MQRSRAGMLARARRLTDTVEPAGLTSKAELLQQQHTSRSASDGGAAASVHAAGGTAALLSVANCGGGGLHGARSVTVGGLRLTYSVFTQAGASPGGSVKDNQDAWCVQEKLAGEDDGLLFGIFDGHGQEGRTVSWTISTQLPAIMSRLASSKATSLEAALAASFPEANAALTRVTGLDADLSGSTGIVAVVAAGVAAAGGSAAAAGAGARLVVANLGDSRCMLGKVDVRGNVTVVPLSSDHTPSDEREAARILASGGRIASFMCGEEPLGPLRVWLRDINVPGLCMTRSFGDYVAASVGVLDTPQITSAVLRPEDKYLVLMSDGIFEFMDNQQVMQEVHDAARDGKSPHEAARRLVRLARKRWAEHEEDIIDDCTAMVVYLSPAAAASAGNSSSGTGGGDSGGKAAAVSAAAAAAAGVAVRLEAGLRIRSPRGSGGGGGGGGGAAGPAASKAGGGSGAAAGAGAAGARRAH